MMLPTINAVWMGRKLGPVHAGCLASFVRVGHRTVLHAFDEIEDVPQGVESFDASRLMAADEIIRHRRTSSLALASDIYRYRILRENLGIYVDRDILCLGPFPDVDYLFGWESERLVNGAVLGMPPDSALLRSVMRDAEDPRFIPPWDGRLRRMTSRMRQILGTADTRPHLKWGSIGPGLITHHVMRLGLERHAMDIDVFYPLHLHHRGLLNDPELMIGDHATRRSLALHLWSSGGAVGEIRTGSTLDRIATGHVPDM